VLVGVVFAHALLIQFPEMGALSTRPIFNALWAYLALPTALLAGAAFVLHKDKDTDEIGRFLNGVIEAAALASDIYQMTVSSMPIVSVMQSWVYRFPLGFALHWRAYRNALLGMLSCRNSQRSCPIYRWQLLLWDRFSYSRLFSQAKKM